MTHEYHENMDQDHSQSLSTLSTHDQQENMDQTHTDSLSTLNQILVPDPLILNNDLVTNADVF